jgi:hypothetical protein
MVNMSENTSDNDDLTPAQEYTVAGAVILFFGLLYWYLNPAQHFNSDIHLAGTQLPKANLAITGQKHPSTLEIAPSSVTATVASSTTSTNAATDSNAKTVANNINAAQVAPPVVAAIPPNHPHSRCSATQTRRSAMSSCSSPC